MMIKWTHRTRGLATSSKDAVFPHRNLNYEPSDLTITMTVTTVLGPKRISAAD
jgi:hypothetical protein